MATPHNRPARIARAWRQLAPDQQRAGVAALALLLSMFLPWYEKNVVVDRALVSDSISAFGVLSFVEAAIFLVAAGVLALLFFRGEQRAFHLPGGDGTAIFAAGAWSAFLLFVRVFDRPDVHGGGSTVGVQWGFFVAFLAAGALAFAGWRMRAVDRPEPTAAQDPTARVEPSPEVDATMALPRAHRRRRTSGSDASTIAGQLSFDEHDEALDRPRE